MTDPAENPEPVDEFSETEKLAWATLEAKEEVDWTLIHFPFDEDYVRSLETFHRAQIEEMDYALANQDLSDQERQRLEAQRKESENFAVLQQARVTTESSRWPQLSPEYVAYLGQYKSNVQEKLYKALAGDLTGFSDEREIQHYQEMVKALVGVTEANSMSTARTWPDGRPYRDSSGEINQSASGK